MNKGKTMASIIQSLRGKNQAYAKHAIIKQIGDCEDTLFELLSIGVVVQTIKVFDDNITLPLYSIDPFYRHRLKVAHQTESIVECQKILFPEGEKEMVQAELFNELKSNFLKS